MDVGARLGHGADHALALALAEKAGHDRLEHTRRGRARGGRRERRLRHGRGDRRVHRLCRAHHARRRHRRVRACHGAHPDAACRCLARRCAGPLRARCLRGAAVVARPGAGDARRLPRRPALVAALRGRRRAGDRHRRCGGARPIAAGEPRVGPDRAGVHGTELHPARRREPGAAALHRHHGFAEPARRGRHPGRRLPPADLASSSP